VVTPAHTSTPLSPVVKATIDLEMPDSVRVADPPNWTSFFAQFKEMRTELSATKALQVNSLKVLIEVQSAVGVLSLTQVDQREVLAFFRSRVVVLEEENKKERGMMATILEEIETKQLLALEREKRELERRDAIQAGSYAEMVRPLASRVHTDMAGQPTLQYHNPTASTTWQPARKDHTNNHPQVQNPQYRCTTLVVHAVM
jgi:hypothetical protein